MKYFEQLADFKEEDESAVTFGKFDGLHKGHQLLVEKVIELSKKEQLSSIVCSLDMTMLWEELGITKHIIMTREERYRHLEEKVDCLVTCPFTREFSMIEAEDFIKDIVKGLFHAKYVVVGSDFTFGRKAKGNIKTLAQFQEKYGYELIVIEKIRYGDRDISSTYIKDTLKEGNITKAKELLGFPYEITGSVIHGKQLGRKLGFPTINVAWPQKKIAPPKGVYLVDVNLDGEEYHAVANIGVKPTVSDENKLSVECFLFDYSGNAYDKEVVIKLHQYCRPEQKFDGVQVMTEQVEKDIAWAKKYFGIKA